MQSRTPLLDSGTLGPKGHVQVIIPMKTESYGSRQDPEENTSIPHCTLKMFPEETLHCVEWAKDLFGTYFSLNPQNFNKLKNADISEVGFNQYAETKNIKKAIKMAEQFPKDFNGCIAKARMKFQKLYYNDILQLIHVYPLDKMTKEGRLFWSLPKRPPKEQVFDQANSIHSNFVAAYACLTANVYGIKIPYDAPRSEEAKLEMAKLASTVEVKEFKPNDAKAREIESQVDKEQKNESEDEEEPLPEEMEEQKEEIKMIDTTVIKKTSISPAHLENYFSETVHNDDIPFL